MTLKNVFLILEFSVRAISSLTVPFLPFSSLSIHTSQLNEMLFLDITVYYIFYFYKFKISVIFLNVKF